VASIANDPGGKRRILFVDPQGDRKAIRLGKVSLRAAEGLKYRVEQLLEGLLVKRPMEADLAAWVTDLDPRMAKKLSGVGLIPKQEVSAGKTTTLNAFIGELIASRPGMKPNTRKNYEQTRNSLAKFFGVERTLSSITPGDCDDWRAKQVGDDYAPATISRNVKRAKQFFRAAVRRRLVAENPLADVMSAAQVNKTREHFVTPADVAKIIDACPDAEWRLIVALVRFGGL
jgi:hypothetical protein